MGGGNYALPVSCSFYFGCADSAEFGAEAVNFGYPPCCCNGVVRRVHRGKPIPSTAVSGVVARALRRGAVDAPLTGAYVFRHTVASHMVQQGTSLKEAADVLGHRSLDTTTTDAKLDLPRLREVALSWPEVLR